MPSPEMNLVRMATGIRILLYPIVPAGVAQDINAKLGPIRTASIFAVSLIQKAARNLREA